MNRGALVFVALLGACSSRAVSLPVVRDLDRDHPRPRDSQNPEPASLDLAPDAPRADLPRDSRPPDSPPFPHDLPRDLHDLAPIPKAWVIPIGGIATSVAVGPSKELYVAGIPAGNPLNSFVAKFSSDGAALWSHASTGSGSNVAYDVAVDKQGCAIVVGHFSKTLALAGALLSSAGGQDIYVAKLAPSGSLLWALAFGGKGFDVAHAVRTDATDAIYVAGEFVDPMQVGSFQVIPKGTNGDVVVFSLTPAGVPKWVFTAGGPGQDRAYNLAIHPSGGALVLGEYQWTSDFGLAQLTSKGGYDFFAARLSQAGTPLWVVTGGGVDADSGSSAVLTPSGDWAIAAIYHGAASFGNLAVTASDGSHHALVLRVTDAGAVTSAHGPWRLWLGHVSVLDANRLLLAGSFIGTLQFGGSALVTAGFTDGFVGTLSLAGKELSSLRAGGGVDDRVFGAAVIDAAQVAAAGEFSKTASFGTLSLTSNPGPSGFLWKLPTP